MLEHELDKRITEKNKPRKLEKNGRAVGLQLKSGIKIIGVLNDHSTNKLVVEDWLDQDLVKEVHRATIVRIMVLIDGGNNDGKLRVYKRAT